MRQLGEAGVAAWKMLADYLNISVQQAMDKVQKRQVDSQTATTAILLGMNKQFAGQLEAQAGTFNGRLTVMTSTFKQAFNAAIVPLFVMLRDQLFPQVTQRLQTFTQVAQSGTISMAFSAATRSVTGLTEALSVGKLVLEAYIARMTFLAVTTVGAAAVQAFTKLRVAITGVTAATIAMNTTFAGTAIASFGSAAAAGAGMVGKLKMAVNALNVAVAALGRNLYWVIPLLAKIASDKIFGFDWNKSVSSLNERQGDGTKPAPMSPIGGGGYGDDLSKEQAARRESSRQEFLNQDRLFIEQVQANQRTLDNLAATPVGGGTGSGSGESKYNKFVQGIKEQMKVLKRSYEIGRISIEEYTEALDKLARTPGLKEVHQLDIIKQKWQALEPIWKQYQDSIDKAEDARLDSYEKGKKFIIQWNATEIEMEKAKAASVLEIQAERDEAELDAGAITKETLLQRKIALEEQMFAVELKALQDRLALGGLEVSERASINQQILQLQIAHNLKLVQLEIQLQQQRKTMAGVAMQEYAATQQSAQDKLVSLPTQLADVFAKAAAGYGSLSDMLKSLAQELVYVAVKAMLLKAVMGLFGGGMFGGANLGGLMGVLHGGGIVGSEGSRRFVSMLPKFHSGGISGDEQLSVLRKGEGVFTPGQMKALGGDTTVINMTIHAIDAKGVNDFFVNNRGVIEGIAVNSIKRSGPVRRAMKGA